MSCHRLAVDDQLALQRLNADFAYCLDHHKVKQLVDLFCETAYYRHDQRISQGRQEIAELFQKRAAPGDRVARHMISGLRLEYVDEVTAAGFSVVTTWAANGSIPISGAEPHLVADFEDLYIKSSDGRWRIARREISRIFVAHGNSGPVGGR